MTGSILKDTATEKYLPVIPGAMVRVFVPHWEPTSPVFTAKKRMCSYKTYTTEKMVGLVCLTSILKERSFGVMEAHLTSITGQLINLTTFTMRIVFILLAYLRITNTNGMMSTVQPVISTAARKVWFEQTRTVTLNPLRHKLA